MRISPTKGQPIMDTTLKEMLISLRGTLHRDMATVVSQVREEFAKLGDRVHNVESKMGEFAVAQNELVDAHKEREENVTLLKVEIAGLETRSRRNNVKFRGVVLQWTSTAMLIKPHLPRNLPQTF